MKKRKTLRQTIGTLSVLGWVTANFTGCVYGPPPQCVYGPPPDYDTPSDLISASDTGFSEDQNMNVCEYGPPLVEETDPPQP